MREFPEIEEFWLIARRVGKLEELAQQFPEKKFVCMGLNLLDPKSFRYLGEKLAEKRSDVRVLVNNAGCGTTGNIGSSASPDVDAGGRPQCPRADHGHAGCRAVYDARREDHQRLVHRGLC
ncbi:MAG: hypothetical protein V8S85_00230 [Oscillospiraceae bacterium]